MAVASILFDLRAGVAKLNSDFAKASKTIDKRLSGFDKKFKAAAGAFAAYFSARAITSFVKGALDAGDALTNLTNRTGISAEALQELRFAGDTLGVSLDEMDASLQRFNRRLGAAATGNASMVKAFKAAGLEIRDASGAVKGAEQLFSELADSMQAMPSDAERAAHAMNLMGNQGLKMVPVLKEGSSGLRALGDEARALGGVMSDEAVAASNRFLTNVGKIRFAAQGARNAIVGAMLPALEGLSEALLESISGTERYAQISEWATRAVTLMAEAADTLHAFLRDLLDPLLAVVSGMSEAEISALSMRGAFSAVDTSADGTSIAVKGLMLVLKSFAAGLYVVRAVLTIVGQGIAAAGAALVALARGRFREAGRIIKANVLDAAKAVSDARDDIVKMWDDSLQPVQLATGAAGSFRRSLEDMRDRSREAASTVRGSLGPALGEGARMSEAAAKAAANLAAKVREAALATRELVAQASGDQLGLRKIAYERDVAALDQALAAKEIRQADYDASILARTKIFEDERSALLREAERQRVDVRLETQAIEASLTESRLDDIRVAHARELEEVRRLEEDKILTMEEANRRRLALQSLYTKEVTEEMQAEAAAAQAVGLSIADAIAQGLKDGFSSDNFRDVFKSILTLFSRIASIIPGGQLAGGIAGIFAGLFAEGGLIRGPGTSTSDSIIARVSDGEFINRAASVQKFGARFFERLNEGVLDLSAIGRYAAGGLVGAAPMQPAMAGIPAPVTQVYVQAMDPSSAMESVSRVVGPAQYQRGLSYADSQEISSYRRRLAPRSGRL